MTVFNHLEDEHLYDNQPVLKEYPGNDPDLPELEQGRSPEHVGRINANIYYTFLTAGTLFIAYGIYQLYTILLASIWIFTLSLFPL